MRKSTAAACAGFAFWFLMAGFMYYRSYGWAMVLGGIAVSSGLIWGGIRRLRRRKADPPLPAPSDLPGCDFKDTKPEDFE